MTIDEAISHALEVAEHNDNLVRWGCINESVTQNCRECAADHRQLAEWLTELKEAKRLLKAAVDDMTKEADCGICLHDNDGECPIKVASCKFKWRYADEALALIGEDTNVPASADNTNVGHKSGGWISCKDRMPDDNELVLFCYVGESGIKSVHYGYHQTVRGLGSSWGKISGGWRYCNDDVTHWMPLPEPPKDGDTNG